MLTVLSYWYNCDHFCIASAGILFSHMNAYNHNQVFLTYFIIFSHKRFLFQDDRGYRVKPSPVMMASYMGAGSSSNSSSFDPLPC